MTRLILIPTAQTEWQTQGRMSGDTDLPLNEYGHRQAVVLGEEIAYLQPSALHCGPEKATRETATIIGHELKLKVRPAKELRELDLGHWEGLTWQEFEDRFARVYRGWRNDPLSIEPPEGEAPAEAVARLQHAFAHILRKHPDETVAVVLGQFSSAIARCEYADHDYERFWDYIDHPPAWCIVEPPPADPRKTGGGKGPGPR